MTRGEAICILRNRIIPFVPLILADPEWSDAVDMAIDALEQPAPKKGKWLVYEVANTEEEQPIAWECSECGAVVDCKTKFCPECGQEKEV